MKRKDKIPKLSRDYSETEITEICARLINWFYEKEDNIYADDFFLLTEKMPATDFENLSQTNEQFKIAMKNAEAIELAKLKKFASGDRLNASIVKQILINKHGWL